MDRHEYSIGSFSVMTHIPVKTLRYYHETGVLIPTRVDEMSGYRYYDDDAFDRARVVQTLRRLEFSHQEIVAMLAECADDEDAIEFFRRKADEIHQTAQRYRAIEREINEIVSSIELQNRKEINMEIAIKDISEYPVIALRYVGRYDEIGPRIRILFRIAARYAGGPVLALHWNAEYRETDADIEACLTLKPESIEKVRSLTERYALTHGATAGTEQWELSDGQLLSVRTLAGEKHYATVHAGAYETIGEGYKRIMDAISEAGKDMAVPIRELYLKGPGMVFRGNPKKYRTEIQVPTNT